MENFTSCVLYLSPLSLRHTQTHEHTDTKTKVEFGKASCSSEIITIHRSDGSVEDALASQA